jgi:O-antigen ligase
MMQIDRDHIFGKVLPWIALGLMVIGFLFNRVVVNVGFLLAGVYAVSHVRESRWLWKDAFFLSIVVIAMLPLISDIYYEGLSFFTHRGVMKWLLVMFPMYVWAWKLDRKGVQIFHYFFISIIGLGSLTSVVQYYGNFDLVNDAYRVSKVMRVWSYGDHIRYSWVVVITCLMAAYEWQYTSHKMRYALYSYVIGQIIFLHLLTAKTGLVILYLTVGLAMMYLLFKYGKWWSILVIPLIGLAPYLSFKFIPSFEQRVRYMIYDWEYYSTGRYENGLSDAVRFYSLMAGKDLIKAHPYIGVGASKLQGETEKWYQAHIPKMGRESYFLPSSQIVIYWAGLGILGLLTFLFHMLIPYKSRSLRGNIWLMLFFIPATLSFTFETHLEGLLPVWVYGFFLSWFWYLGREQK